ncbi:uncharacterized protein LOC117291263 [Asterias rubens]|uniref:uncharacterized protein LOC117291263 n=1 Tax=Asterias rubens TaxID=7604 RepID=UPI001455D0A7|nr:uncharacterized protein LOC117291263 [Asterias rubens]
MVDKKQGGSIARKRRNRKRSLKRGRKRGLLLHPHLLHHRPPTVNKNLRPSRGEKRNGKARRDRRRRGDVMTTLQARKATDSRNPVQKRGTNLKSTTNTRRDGDPIAMTNECSQHCTAL